MFRGSTAVVLMSLLAFVLVGCKKETTPPPATGTAAGKTPDKPKPTGDKKGIAKGNAKLVAAFQNVLKNCEVSDWGFIKRKSCKNDPEAEKKLKKQEKMVGLKESLTTYCYGLDDENHLARALASYRISSMNYSKRMAEAADKDVFACLKMHLGKNKERKHVRRLAKAVAYMGTALKLYDETIKALESHPMKQAREAGYGALWANGRLKVLPTLEKVIKAGKDKLLQQAAIRGFGSGDRFNTEEEQKVCGLLVPLMTHDELGIASSAASRVGSSCKKNRDDVIAAAETMVKNKKFNLTYVSALRSAAGYFRNKASKAQSKKIIGVFKKVLKEKSFSALTRSTALSGIYHLDKKHGVKMAKKYAKDDAKFVKKEAARILAKKK